MGKSGLVFVDYESWNNILCNYFFNEVNQNKTMYLYVNDDVIEKLGKELKLRVEDALKSLCQSIVYYMGNNRNEIFETAYVCGRKWFNQGMNGFPPFLAVLAINVLAATKMNTDFSEGIHGNNYYRRLRDLLQLEGSGKPKDFERCNDLWEMLVAWQKACNGEYGYFNIFKFGTEYIGYARSQCLIRDNEKEIVYNFFQWAGLRPRESITNHQLEEQLEMYLYKKNNRLSKFFFSKELKDREAVVSLLLFELEKWDGGILSFSTVERERGWDKRAKSHDLFLKLDVVGTIRKKINTSLFGLVEDLENKDLSYTTLDGFEILDGAIKRDVSFSEISSDFNFELESLGIRAKFKARGTFLLRNGLDKGINGWIEREDIQLNQNHILLTNSTHRVESWLKSNQYKFKEIKLINHPKDWFFYVFNPEESKPLNSILLGREIHINEEAEKLVYTGGLKIQHNEWMLEYPPNLIVQAKSRSTVFLNDKPILSIIDNMASIDLRDLHITEPAVYEFRVNASKCKCLLRNDYKNKLSFDSFVLEGHTWHQQEMNISGTYIYEELNEMPPLIEYEGEGARVTSDNHLLHVPIDKDVSAPPFKVGRNYNKITLELVDYGQVETRDIDILFEYLSIRRIGNWKVFLEAIKLIFGEKDCYLTAYKVRKNLSSLGFVEFIRKPFSKSYDWKVIPPSAAILPCETPMVYLTGGRTRSFLKDVKRCIPRNLEMKVTVPRNELEPISIIFIDEKSNNMNDLGEFLDAINVKFNIGEDYFAYDLLRCLPSLTKIVNSLKFTEKPNFSYDWKIKAWDFGFHKWIRGQEGELSVYKNAFGQERCFFAVTSQRVVEIYKELGMLYAAARHKQPLTIFVYSDYTLKIRKEYQLPDLYERVLVSCVGQCPYTEGNYRIYRNVPYDIALVTSVRLGFSLEYLKRR
ncbi:hypothetical protein CN975_16465 [Bacillus cereus]|uniref:hypothetical protein n=1 Tax=Bacillus cereus TaxID=1396 RepID=UPI000BF74ED4|nr:hypothetical protein [Bacillus cereus]PEQ99007.1 hypothetical protein CN477_25815 [Bacillus cereus]PFC05039.1 hypothetical protein CN280_16945 [Bacillus cereus]PFF10703.1 hypothetical protein CN343_25030 [Bacillus cereus]PFK21477.1 hypothetical protein COJ03_16880 [Bacillus cereus]PGK12234.1 hypothetical protein CN895_18250 [Bacillus cereus]